MKIRPISDLRNNFAAIEAETKQGDPIYLTKNRYGSMVVMDIEEYARLTNDVELKLDAADMAAKLSKRRLSHRDIFGKYK